MKSAYRLIASAIGLLFLVAVFLSATVAFSQDTEHSVPLSELDKYKLQAAEATASFETLRMDTIIRNFVESNPQVKAFNESAGKAVAERDALRTQLFQAAGLAPSDYELRDGAFVKIDKATTK